MKRIIATLTLTTATLITPTPAHAVGGVTRAEWKTPDYGWSKNRVESAFGETGSRFSTDPNTNTMWKHYPQAGCTQYDCYVAVKYKKYSPDDVWYAIENFWCGTGQPTCEWAW